MPNPDPSQDAKLTGVPGHHSQPLSWKDSAKKSIRDNDITANIRTVTLRRESPQPESLSISFITAHDFRPAAIGELLDNDGSEHFLIRPPAGPFDIKDVNSIAWGLFNAFERGSRQLRDTISRSSLITHMDSDTFDIICGGRVGLILERPEHDLLTRSILPDVAAVDFNHDHQFDLHSPNLIRHSTNRLAEWAVVRADKGFSLIVAPRDIARGQKITLTFTTDDVALQEILRAAETIGINDESRSLHELHDIFSRSLGWVQLERPREDPQGPYSPILQLTKDLLKLPAGCKWHSDMPSARVTFDDFYKMSRGCEFFSITLPPSMDNTISELRGWMGKDKRCVLEVRNPTLNKPEARDQGSVIEFTINFKGPAQSVAHHLAQVIERFILHTDKIHFVSAMMREYDFKVPRANDPRSHSAEHEALALCVAGDLISKFEVLSNSSPSRFQPTVALRNISSGCIDVLFTGRAGATLSFRIEGRTIISAEISTTNMFVGTTSEAYLRSSRHGNRKHTVSELIQAFRDISWIDSLLPARFTTLARLMREGFY